MLGFSLKVEGRALHITLPTVPDDCMAIVLDLGNRKISVDLDKNFKWETEDIHQIREDFLTHISVNENKSPTTINWYKNRLKQFTKWLEKHEKSPHLANSWQEYYAHLQNRGLSPYTVRGHYNILQRFGRWMVERGFLALHPLQNTSAPRLPTQKPPQAAQYQTVEIMLAEAKKEPRDLALLLFFLDTGCRANEALQLKWSDLDFKKKTATVLGKGQKYRAVFWTETTNLALKQYRQSLPPRRKNGALWWGRKGELTYDGLYKTFVRLAESAPGRGNPHAMRHLFGKHLSLENVPSTVLQKLLGHSSIKTTEIYSEFNTTDLQSAHEKHSPVKHLSSSSNLTDSEKDIE